jgi:hypothetical protein
MTPERNLDVQTAVIAGAEGFVGSYGGLSYLPPLYGVRSIAFHSQRMFKTTHLDLAERVISQVDGGSLLVLDAAGLRLLRDILRPRPMPRAPIPSTTPVTDRS